MSNTSSNQETRIPESIAAKSQGRFLAEQAVAWGSGESCRSHLSATLARESKLMEDAATVFQRTWPKVTTLLLCDRMAKKNLAVVAVDGECPVHGGDGCLYAYAQVVAIRNAMEAEARGE